MAHIGRSTPTPPCRWALQALCSAQQRHGGSRPSGSQGPFYGVGLGVSSQSQGCCSWSQSTAASKALADKAIIRLALGRQAFPPLGLHWPQAVGLSGPLLGVRLEVSSQPEVWCSMSVHSSPAALGRQGTRPPCLPPSTTRPGVSTHWLTPRLTSNEVPHQPISLGLRTTMGRHPRAWSLCPWDALGGCVFGHLHSTLGCLGG